MRIAVDIRSLMEGRHSGVEEYTVRLIRAMVGLPSEHDFILFYNSVKDVKIPEFGQRAQIKRFRYPNKMMNVFQCLWGLPRWDEMVDADCFFVPNFRLLPIKGSVPIVMTVHDLSFERFPELFCWKRRLWHKIMKPRKLVKSATKVVAVSEATGRDVVDLYGVSRKKVEVVYSGIGADQKKTSDEKAGSLRKVWGLPERYILFLGTLEPRKNVVSVIRAFDAVAQFVKQDLVVAGEKGWLGQEMAGEIEKAKHKRRMHVIGSVREKDKSSLYEGADLFVYPSFYEGFGFPPLEALVREKPVITSNNSSLPEIVGDWATLVDYGDVAELALVMLEELPKVGANVKKSVYEKYSWERAAAQTLRVIEQSERV